jgi:hypothetical protein
MRSWQQAGDRKKRDCAWRGDNLQGECLLISRAVGSTDSSAHLPVKIEFAHV